MEENEFKGRNEVFSKSVRAGKKRTYFFDVKETRSNDFYLVITESKRKFGDDGTPMYEKHKIFLYKEDFEKFTEALNETTAHIRTIAPESTYEHNQESYSQSAPETTPDPPAENKSEFTDLNFEDLGGEEPKE